MMAAAIAVIQACVQHKCIDRMQHRKDLYQLLEYQRYNQFDDALFNFTL